ncbi:hypothetical protein [Streptomyces sp. NPDC014622]|uniref:hypothetical protein n=1 Tax=Streptomyces sp. NPDC014622 TaxID=3364874 RepID=UPI0036FD2177
MPLLVLLVLLVVLHGGAGGSAAQHSHGPAGTPALLVQQAALRGAADPAVGMARGPLFVLLLQNNPV